MLRVCRRRKEAASCGGGGACSQRIRKRAALEKVRLAMGFSNTKQQRNQQERQAEASRGAHSFVRYSGCFEKEGEERSGCG